MTSLQKLKQKMDRAQDAFWTAQEKAIFQRQEQLRAQTFMKSLQQESPPWFWTSALRHARTGALLVALLYVALIAAHYWLFPIVDRIGEWVITKLLVH